MWNLRASSKIIQEKSQQQVKIKIIIEIIKS